MSTPAAVYPIFNFNAPRNRTGVHTWVRLMITDKYISCQDCGILNLDPAAGEVCPNRPRLDILNAPITDEAVKHKPLSQIPGSGVTPW